MILYFSATGNTKYCAKRIAEHFCTDLVSLNYNIKNEIYEIDCSNIKRLGIISPIYDYDISWTVTEYLEKVSFKNLSSNIYIFAVFTCGQTSGYAYKTLKNILNKKNMKLNSAFTIKMIGNYIPIFPLPTDKRQKKILTKADKDLNKIIQQIKENKEINEFTTFMPKWMYRIIRKKYIPIQKKTENFWVNNSCNGCKLCSKVCHQNIIKIENNKPQWKKRYCDCCLACLHKCPQKAIQYKNKTQKAGRYINPNIDLDI